MSDTTERDAVLAKFYARHAVLAKFYARHNGLRTLSAVRAAVKVDMADEIVRLRDENAALRAAVERVLALHEVFGDWCDRCDCVAPCATLRALEGTP